MHSVRIKTAVAALAAAGALAGCGREEAKQPKFDTVPIGKRDIVVSVEASGSVEPLLTVEIKSKASGEVLKVAGETGQVITAGTLLVQIDKRTPRNMLAQAESDLEAAIARRNIANTQNERAKRLFETRTINEQDYETTQLEHANAKADVVKSQVAVENARITMDDTDVRAPITGTIIDKLVETGQVISSPMKDFGGGTSLMKMADLTTVQVRALVDETDVGKIQPGKPVTVKVTAYPNQPFPGTVDKIEPQAKADQSVTTFAVLIRLPNPQGLLRPGMNADVEIRVAERANVLAVPTVALRTTREVATMATAVGLDEATVQQQLGGGDGKGPPRGTAGGDSSGSRWSRAGQGQGQADGNGRGGASYEYGGHFWTFVERDGKPVAVNVETGITNLDYNEVISGLKEGDQVIMLPSAGYMQAQARGRDAMRRFSVLPGGGGGGTGGAAGGAGGRQQGQSQGQGQGGQGGGGGAPR